MTTSELEAAWSRLTGSSVKVTVTQEGKALFVIGKLLGIANNLAIIEAAEGTCAFSLFVVVSIFAERQKADPVDSNVTP